MKKQTNKQTKKNQPKKIKTSLVQDHSEFGAHLRMGQELLTSTGGADPLGEFYKLLSFPIQKGAFWVQKHHIRYPFLLSAQAEQS